VSATAKPQRPLVLTQGEPAGIGIEIAARAWQSRSTPPFVLIADPQLVRARLARLALDVAVEEVPLEGAAERFPAALPVIATGYAAPDRPGLPDPATAAGTIAAIDRAAELVRRGSAAALVTNPVAKETLYRAGFAHPGHTEYLAELAARLWGTPARPVMLLWSPTLAVVPVTIHVPLVDVPRRLTSDAIIETVRIVARDYRRRFGIAAPRIALTGLNPHAGEGGAMGDEEIRILAPALAALRAEGIQVAGPFPADTMFHARARAGYDVAVAMYHDQGLIPIKTLAFDEAVNATLGLPFIRCSPDHGVAFDIAAAGIARPDSLIAAMNLAARLSAAENAPAG
jgi:4-hydroxythreonine-4-phosphate dehydrogenase